MRWGERRQAWRVWGEVRVGRGAWAARCGLELAGLPGAHRPKQAARALGVRAAGAGDGLAGRVLGGGLAAGAGCGYVVCGGDLEVRAQVPRVFSAEEVAGGYEFHAGAS